MKKRIFAAKKMPLHLPVWAAAVLLLISAGVLTFAVFYLQYHETDGIISGIKTATAEIILLNFIPVLLLMLLVFFLTGRFSAAFFSVTFVFSALSLVNRVKSMLRQDPLVPSDFALGAEALIVVKNLDILSILGYAAIVCAVIALGVLLAIYIKNQKIAAAARILGAALVLTAVIVLNNTVYSSDKLYESLPVTGNRYNLVNQYNSRGFIYCFLYQMNDTGVFARKTPLGYNRDTLLSEIEANYAATEYPAQNMPHIIVIMGEAFTELSSKGNFDFTNYADPLQNYKRLKNEGISGDIIVPHSGGGTADTEFEFLTGLSKREIEYVSYGFRLISKPYVNLTTYFEGLGMQSVFIHPGAAWFYNRQNVYTNLGFDESYFEGYFEGTKTKGGYINEYDTISAVIDIFEAKRAQNPNAPVFEYCVTIQNHGPYGDKYVDTQKNFNTSAALTEDEENLLSNYFEGVADQDENLGRLTDYLNTLSEPVLLLYFGDHAPSMQTSVFEKAGLNINPNGEFNERIELYKAPYLFWQNSAYKSQKTVNAEDLDLPQNGETMSVSYLGAALADYAGYGNISELFGFLNAMRREIPVITKSEYVTREGYKMYENLTEAEAKKILLYKQWQYYKLYDE
ncbi:MAG: LTA synthase family protein [Clostridiales bacterium]|jgi:phosphoglycerol transferase MdoB-like AlkP superfamily enzyme|nr:LTA synthase family protein [Clostridiales bacterium]